MRQQIEDTSSVLDVVRAEVADLPNQEQRKLDPEKDLDLVRVSYECGGILGDRVKGGGIIEKRAFSRGFVGEADDWLKCFIISVILSNYQFL